MNTRPWAGVTPENLPGNLSLSSLLSRGRQLLVSTTISLVHRYSKQIEWWFGTSKAVVYISFIYSIMTLQFKEGAYLLATCLSLTSGFAFVFCLCKKILETNFQGVIKLLTHQLKRWG